MEGLKNMEVGTCFSVRKEEFGKSRLGEEVFILLNHSVKKDGDETVSVYPLKRGWERNLKDSIIPYLEYSDFLDPNTRFLTKEEMEGVAVELPLRFREVLDGYTYLPEPDTWEAINRLYPVR